MTQSVTLINTSTDTWQGVIDKVNELANLVSNTVVTANSDANGSVTTGNAYGNGIFAYTTLTVETALRGGNVQSAAALPISSNVHITGTLLRVGSASVNAVINSTSFTVANSTVSFSITKPTAAQVSSGNFYLNANGSYVDIASAEEVTTSGTSAQLITSYLTATYYSAEHQITVDDQNANNRLTTKIITLHDEGTAYHTEYATVTSNSAMGTFSANANSTAVRVYFTPTSTDTEVRVRSEYTTK